MPYFIPRVDRAYSPVRISSGMGNGHGVGGIDLGRSCIRIVLDAGFVFCTLFAAFVYPYDGSLCGLG